MVRACKISQVDTGKNRVRVLIPEHGDLVSGEIAPLYGQSVGGYQVGWLLLVAFTGGDFSGGYILGRAGDGS